jgi:protein-tyrosine phosphatase
VIDLHCHMLPAIDDGPTSLEGSLAMAKMAVADGITTTFCTPHIYPGLYENKADDIKRRVANLQLILNDKGIALTLNYGADVHLVPEINAGIESGRIPLLGGSRYLLLEPSHHVRPPRFTESVFRLISDGITPIITHPERLSWYGQHSDDFVAIAKSGAWLQVTSGALLGHFGPAAKRFSEQLIGDGWCDVLASDGHTTGRRSPVIADARERAAQLVDETEATAMVETRPNLVLNNLPTLPDARPPAHQARATSPSLRAIIRGVFGRNAI